VDEDFFSDLLNTHRPGIVLLQACEGGQSSASKAFVGVASRVVQQNIPVVVAMQYEVSNQTAVRFALRFYQQLAEMYPVDRAAQNGRRAVALSTQYKGRDFATPVLFMRVADGYLFFRKKVNNQAEQVKEIDAVIDAKPSSDTAHSTDAGSVPLTQDAYSIHVLLQRFSINELAELANNIGLDIENLGASGKNAIAMSLMLTAQRHYRLDKLVIQIASMRPDIVNELKANLYVFMENIKERDLAQLCQELQLDCRGMKFDEKGLLGYTANKYIRTERTQALQDYMVQNGRYAELVQAVKRKLPGVDLSIFG
ncbi:MAG: CHAT domain-containing protein, partial [Chloroflexota bacterium]